MCITSYARKRVHASPRVTLKAPLAGEDAVAIERWGAGFGIWVGGSSVKLLCLRSLLVLLPRYLIEGAGDRASHWGCFCIAFDNMHVEVSSWATMMAYISNECQLNALDQKQPRILVAGADCAEIHERR